MKSRLRVARADGSKAGTLLSLPGRIEDLSWAPDGSRLAFVLRIPNAVVRIATWTDFGDRRDIYLINKDGSGLQLVATVHAAAVGGLDFSPDGSRLAFESDAQGLRSIYTVGLNAASVPVRLTPLNVWGDDPRWSPDGTRVAFRGGTELLNAPPTLWTINADGSNLRELDALTYEPPSWSPDGRWLAYAGASGISVIRADGSRKRNLTSAQDYSPIWSSTGLIAFGRNMAPECWCERALWVMDADGSDQRRVSRGGEVAGPFAWSR